MVGTLRTAGLRVTPVRLATAAAVERRPHADADAVIRQVLADIGTVSRQSVYNALACLVDARLARRIEPAGSPARFELRVGDNHHHVVCRRCGSVADVDCAVGRRPCLTPSDAQGYVLDEAEITFWGVCPDCQGRVDQRGEPGAGDDELQSCKR
ncbi:MAG: Fur family transcriptional regulator [Acidimicrobiales bacterium]